MNEHEKLKLLGKNIAEYRKAKKLTQNALAEKVDVSIEHIAKIETAKKGLSLSLLFKISDALDIDIKDLFEF